MLLIKAKRVIKAGFVNFWRNGWVSLVAVLIMTVTLFIVGSLVFARALLDSTLAQLEDKVDVSVYFKASADDEEIIALKEKLEKLNEVSSVQYITSEEALRNFREKHKDNALILQSLEELGDNPLGATLNIKAKQTSQYESVAKFFDDYSVSVGELSVVDKVNYYQNKIVIERLSSIIESTKRLGVIISVIFVLISFLVTFNTIRLAIYTAREEIGVMRLVGASNRFISGPFVVEGILYGIASSIAALAIFYPLVLWLGPLTEGFFSGINIYRYYIENFAQIFSVLFLFGVILGALSSLVAVRRYLKV